MKRFLILACFACAYAQAFECEVQFENDQVIASRVVIEPKEEVGLHRDALPHVVVALKGGTITRLETGGREVDVQFPTGKAVYRPIDPENELHRSVNKSNERLELIIIQLKK